LRASEGPLRKKYPPDSPHFDNSAMDGFAVKWKDVESISAKFKDTVTLCIVGESKAGAPWEGKLKSGEAVRINTGAVVPDGADTVIPVEETETKSEQNLVTIKKAQQEGNHIRRRGEEYRKGTPLLATGTKLTPAVAGMLGSLGKERIKTYAPPKVMLMITGTELAQAGQDKLGEGQIFDSNRPMLQQFLKLSGVNQVDVIHVTDDQYTTREALQEARSNSDIIITTGGVSVGPHDHIPANAEKAGFKPVFHFVAQKPGKPFFFAASDNNLCFGLPGNPVSAFMTFVWYIYPELRYYLGDNHPFHTRRGVLKHSINNHRGKSVFMRANGKDKAEKLEIETVKRQGSHMLHTLTRAVGFIIVPPKTTLKKGRLVEFYFFPER